VRVSREEAFEVYKRQASTATAKYVALDRDWFARFAVDLSAASIDAWALQHKDQIEDAFKTEKDRFSAGCSLVSEIVFPFESDATDAQKAQLRTAADAALEHIQKGHVPFEVEARQSGKGDTALAGGYLGCLNESYGTGAKELMEAVGRLKDHEVSGVIESARGFHILRSEGKLNEAELDATVRHSIARRMAARFQADEAMHKFAAQLSDKAKAGADLEKTLDALLVELVTPKGTAKAAAAKAMADKSSPALSDAAKPKVTVSMPFTIDETPGREFMPSQYSGVGAKIFALDKPGAFLPQPVQTIQGVAVVSLVSKKEVTREDFDKDASLMMERMREEKSREALVDYVARLRKAAAASIKVDDDLKNMKIRGADE
jgi:parvulin-like peptidyl-prolyl isomerase